MATRNQPKPKLTHRRLLELLSYDAATGIFRWRKTMNGFVRAGSIAGSPNAEGYLQIQIDRVKYRSARLAFLYVHGRWPTDQIDHADVANANDAFLNLREAPRSLNGGNKRRYRNNKSGFKGVSRRSDGKKWVAQIQVNGVYRHIGSFETRAEAYAAYCARAKEFFGEFANRG